jgi:uncharacterized membrane protein YwaF
LKEGSEMAGNGGRIAGVISIVLSALAAVFAILNYTSRHTRRGLAALIACGILLVLGIILIVAAARGSKQSPTP